MNLIKDDPVPEEQPELAYENDESQPKPIMADSDDDVPLSALPEDFEAKEMELTKEEEEVHTVVEEDKTTTVVKSSQA